MKKFLIFASALAMTANTAVFKEDQVTLGTPFDKGSGRIQVDRAINAGLVMHETKANYLAADPALGGDLHAVGAGRSRSVDPVDLVGQGVRRGHLRAPAAGGPGARRLSERPPACPSADTSRGPTARPDPSRTCA